MSKRKVLCKCTILHWAALIATLGPTQPAGCRLDTPGSLRTELHDGWTQGPATSTGHTGEHRALYWCSQSRPQSKAFPSRLHDFLLSQ